MSNAPQKAQVLAELNRVANTSGPDEVLNSEMPVMGYFSTYIPPELILAAGLYPIRIRGGVEDSSSGDAYLSHLTCSLARNITSTVLDGAYDFLAGQIAVNTCDHIRRTNDVLVNKTSIGFNAFVSVPRSFRESLFPWFLEELELLKQSLEQHFKVKITDQSLEQAIQRMDAVRQRLQRLDQFRAQDQPKLSGSGMLAAAVAAQTLLPEKFVELADELISAAEASEPIPGIRARLILTGGQLDDPRFIKAIESQGAHIAGDTLCFGSSKLEQSAQENISPLSALARAYFYQSPSARMMGEFPKRYQNLLELYHERQARGLIFQSYKFCQIWASEIHHLRHRFEDEPLPMLTLEREYGTISTGQIKTRVQAFLERLGA